MANPTCFASLQACALRVAKLDAAGAPVAGAENGYVSDALISVQASVNLQTGDEFTQKDGCGNIAQYFKDCDHIKSLAFTMNLCQLDAQLISFLTEGELIESGGTAIGFKYPAVTASCANGVSFEVWTKAWDGTQQAVPAFTSPDAAYWHFVFPKVQWVLGNIQLDNSIMVVPVTGTGYENSHLTIDGPFNDWPAAVADSGGIVEVGGVFLDDVLPTATCAPVTVPVTS